MITGQIGGRYLESGAVTTMSNSPTLTKVEKTLPGALWIVTAIVLVAAAFPLPYGYYTFARIVTCLACAVLAYSAYTSIAPNVFWTGVLVLLAVLFNPIIHIHLTKRIWMVLDLGAAGLIIAHLALVRGIASKY
jgi:hypothetical protein